MKGVVTMLQSVSNVELSAVGMSVDDDDPDGDPSSQKSHSPNIRTFINDLKNLVSNGEGASDSLIEYIDDFEKEFQKSSLDGVDRDKIKTLIEKHPYFKNPSTYHIRQITIMKYLRKKGIDVSVKDIDLLVDSIIMTIDGVEKIGYGKYRRKRF